MTQSQLHELHDLEINRGLFCGGVSWKGKTLKAHPSLIDYWSTKGYICAQCLHGLMSWTKTCFGHFTGKVWILTIDGEVTQVYTWYPFGAYARKPYAAMIYGKLGVAYATNGVKRESCGLLCDTACNSSGLFPVAYAVGDTLAEAKDLRQQMINAIEPSVKDVLR